MAKNRFELHEERLGTTDEKGHRVYLYPEDIKGIWRHRRDFFYWTLIVLYLVLPWTRFGGKQTILLNIGAREFTLFGQTFFASDLPLLLILILGGLFLIGFITSIWGRVWCGWACPQTVFIDAIYRKIEILVEGKARARAALAAAPWTKEKVFKRILKWTLYLIVSLHIAHSFLGYFVGARDLFWITRQPPSENMGLFIAMIGITALCMFDFGWFREQFCIIACPYGRLQSVIMDKDSMVVAYDPNRGEPRRGVAPTKEDEGDCINCYHCVKACPTGIDIRRGTQLECIACTNCIDACDEIMEKVGRPAGLIRYATETELEGGKVSHFRPRSVIYLAVSLSIFLAGIFLVSRATKMSFTAIRAVGVPFTISKNADGITEIQNRYVVTIDVKEEEQSKPLWFSSPSPNVKVISAPRPITPKVGHTRVNVFFKFPPEILQDGSQIISLEAYQGEEEDSAKLVKKMEIKLVGPF